MSWAPTCSVQSVSGGTDVCAAFVGAVPLLPVRAGEISCRLLGVAVEAFDPDGHVCPPGVQGELVVTEPMPSMPVGFWGDSDGSEQLRRAYFSDYPGVWRHGDWITFTDDGACVISGRTDATLNRGGVRLGTSDFYAVVEALPEVADSLVVHLEGDDPDQPMGELLLFVALTPGADARRRPARRDRARAAHRAVAATRAGRDPRGTRGTAHALGQEARGAGQADPERGGRRRRRQPQLARRPGGARVVRGVRGVALTH